ncbi:MAG: hypothetical protein AMXMBFR34_18760 [Myxococcaceae bacterium]
MLKMGALPARSSANKAELLVQGTLTALATKVSTSAGGVTRGGREQRNQEADTWRTARPATDGVARLFPVALTYRELALTRGSISWQRPQRRREREASSPAVCCAHVTWGAAA